MKTKEVFDTYLKKYETYNIFLTLKRKDVDDLLENATVWLNKEIHLLFQTCFYMFVICYLFGAGFSLITNQRIYHNTKLLTFVILEFFFFILYYTYKYIPFWFKKYKYLKAKKEYLKMCDENQRLMLLNLLANTNNILAMTLDKESKEWNKKYRQNFEKEMNSTNEFLIKELEK
jgi:hypothetical protein